MFSPGFNQNPSEANRAAEDGPLIVTDRGKPAYVLLRYDAYQRLTGERGAVPAGCLASGWASGGLRVRDGAHHRSRPARRSLLMFRHDNRHAF